MIPFQKLSEKILSEAIDAVLSDPKYSNRAREYGSLVADQIEHPLKRATWWLEHIMRHPHVYRNKSPVHKLTWYQYFCLDVIFTIGVFVLFIFYIIYKSVKLCCGSKTKKDKRE